MNIKAVGFGLLSAFVLFAVPALAADIVINWENKGDPLCPAQVNWSKSGSILVTSVNDLLYSYHVHTRLVPWPIDDFQLLRGGAPESVTATCAGAVLAAENAAAAFEKEFAANPALNPQPEAKGKYGSTPLSRTVAASMQPKRVGKVHLSPARFPDRKFNLWNSRFQCRSCDYPEYFILMNALVCTLVTSTTIELSFVRSAK